MTKNDSSSTHPPLLSTTEDDRISHLRLLRSRRVGPVTYARLLAEHGSAAAALDALPHIARDAGVSDYEVCPIGVVHGELKAARAAKARLVFKGEPDFPRSLANINVAPVMLWMIGVALVLQRPMVALFGARNALSLGTRMAHKQAQELGEAGFTVVSGLARGVDAAAHDGSFSTARSRSLQGASM
jgi:DNA processing protein